MEYLINNDMKQIQFVRIDYLEATREFILKGMVSLSHNDASRTFQNMVFFLTRSDELRPRGPFSVWHQRNSTVDKVLFCPEVVISFKAVS